jgi:predicted secreted protein
MAHFEDPEVAGSIVATRDYTKKYLCGEDTFKAGTKFIVIEVHKSFPRGIYALTVRNPKTGEFFKKVPWDIFRAT